MSPEISIVVVAAAGSRSLGVTLGSLADQQAGRAEVIIANLGEAGTADAPIRAHRAGVAGTLELAGSSRARAVNRGFGMARGRILCWLNAGDVLSPGALETVTGLFAGRGDIHWLAGNRDQADAQGAVVRSEPPRPHSLLRFLVGDYDGVPRQACFWSRELWLEAGGRVDETFNQAFATELWFRFFRHARLATLAASLGAAGPDTLRERRRFVDRQANQIARAAALVRRNLPEAYAKRHAGILSQPFWQKDAIEAEMLDPGIVVEDLPPLARNSTTGRYLIPDGIVFIPEHSQLSQRAVIKL